MITYRATLDVPDDLVSWLENIVATRRSEAGGTWRALTSYDQAVLALVYLLTDATYVELGRSFCVATDTAWRYVDETLDALAPLAPTLTEALTATGEERRALLDGTLIRTWRCTTMATDTNRDPLYSGKHHDHGVNVQALTSTSGDLLYLGQARPGSRHDLAAARADGIIDAVTEAGIEVLADSGYQGVGGTIRTPIKRPKGKGHNGWEKRANSAHARVRAAAEWPFARLKRWRILTRLRTSPNRATRLLHAIFVLDQKRSSLSRA